MEEQRNYIPFTEEMRKDYTILVPNMLPMHFSMILGVLEHYGYQTDLLTSTDPKIIETGLKYVHNDTCYPAILVIGQFIDALQSGKYDVDHTALLLFQTGGGCRASNYIFLLRKALEKAGFAQVPVISFNFSGLESHPGFQMTFPIFHRMVYGILYADLLMSLLNQCKPYELQKGDAQALADAWTKRLVDEMTSGRVSFGRAKKNMRKILADFAALPQDRTKEKIPVGVVGEIYVKYSPLGNNRLEEFLVQEGAEAVVPGLLDFCLYCMLDMYQDAKRFGSGKIPAFVLKWVYRFVLKKQREIIAMYKEYPIFRAPSEFSHTVARIEPYMDLGCAMGEGFLLPAEMLELYDSGVKNIVCTQPFGCLPNHICGKGMMKPLKDNNPDMNIVAIDYDASASRVNQENRLKLMLANARLQLKQEQKELPQASQTQELAPEEALV